MSEENVTDDEMVVITIENLPAVLVENLRQIAAEKGALGSTIDEVASNLVMNGCVRDAINRMSDSCAEVNHMAHKFAVFLAGQRGINLPHATEMISLGEDLISHMKMMMGKE